MEGKNTNKSEHNRLEKQGPGMSFCTRGHKALPSSPPLPSGLTRHLRACSIPLPSQPPTLQSWAGEGMNTHLGVGMGGWGQEVDVDELTGRYCQGFQQRIQFSVTQGIPAERDTESTHPSPPSRAVVPNPYRTSGCSREL